MGYLGYLPNSDKIGTHQIQQGVHCYLTTLPIKIDIAGDYVWIPPANKGLSLIENRAGYRDSSFSY